MEELWKEMSLASTPSALQFQYHLSSPPAAYLNHGYHPAAPQPPRTPLHAAPHTTASSLEFTYLGDPASSNSTSSGDGEDSRHHMPGPFGNGADIFSSSFAGVTGGSSSMVTVQEGGDRRQRRMVKNRESAARSRARKQAYTNELELERAQLRRENAMLIQRQHELHARLALVAAEAPDQKRAETPDRSTHQRCRSAEP